MAKKNTAVAARASTAPVPADMMKSLAIDAQNASGFEAMGADDLAIPFLVVLQSNSPQVRGSTKIKGAAEGMLYNTVSGLVYDTPVRFVPCFFQKLYVEWVPREKGGGFVKQHPDATLLEKCTRNSKGQDQLPSGNLLVRTGYHYGLMLGKNGEAPQPMVIGMSSTQLKRSRRWNSQAMALKVNLGGKMVTPPLYSHSYLLSTVEETNDKGTWSSWDVSDPQMLDDPAIYQAAKDFHQAIRAGSVRVAPPPSQADEVEVPDEDDNTL